MTEEEKDEMYQYMLKAHALDVRIGIEMGIESAVEMYERTMEDLRQILTEEQWQDWVTQELKEFRSSMKKVRQDKFVNLIRPDRIKNALKNIEYIISKLEHQP